MKRFTALLAAKSDPVLREAPSADCVCREVICNVISSFLADTLSGAVGKTLLLVL
jgi:hypothetical protein